MELAWLDLPDRPDDMRCDCQEVLCWVGEVEACMLGPVGVENSPRDNPCRGDDAGPKKKKKKQT